MNAPAAVQENSSWWKVDWSWSLDSRALLHSLKSQMFVLRKCVKWFSLLSKISRQLFIDNCHLKFSRLIFQIVILQLVKTVVQKAGFDFNDFSKLLLIQKILVELIIDW